MARECPNNPSGGDEKPRGCFKVIQFSIDFVIRFIPFSCGLGIAMTIDKRVLRQRTLFRDLCASKELYICSLLIELETNEVLFQCGDSGHMAQDCTSTQTMDGPDGKPRENYIPQDEDENLLFEGSIKSGVNFNDFDNIPLQVCGLN